MSSITIKKIVGITLGLIILDVLLPIKHLIKKEKDNENS